MNLNRRDMMLALLTATGGALLGSPTMRVMAGEMPVAKASRAIFSAAQSQAIAALAEMIIPTTDTPGAITAGAPAFIEMMVTDWCTDTERGIFFDGLKGLDSFCRSSFGKDFLGCTDEQRYGALIEAEQQAASYKSPFGSGMSPVMARVIDENTPFFTKIKELTLLGYYTSEVGAKQELSYNPMPMRYEGDYDYATVGRRWSA